MWGFSKIPSVISGKSANLLPPSVMRAASPALGLRDRIRAAQGVLASMAHVSMPTGDILKPSARFKWSTSRLSPLTKFW